MSRFAELLKDLQEEHEKQTQEVARLRSELSSRLPGEVTPNSMEKDNTNKMALSPSDGASKPTKIPSRPMSVRLSNKASKPNSKKFGMGLDDVQAEWKKQFANFIKSEDDTDKYSVPLGQRIFYFVENYSSLYDNFFLYTLIFITAVAAAVLGFFWEFTTKDETPDLQTFFYYYDMLQVITTGGIDDTLREGGMIVVMTTAIFVGMLVFAILIGIITEKFQGLVMSINEGTSKVPEGRHTLLLGFNESTERVCCQIAFLRRKYIMNNSGFMQKWFRIGRIPPATPVAAGRIVILCSNKTKAEMHERIQRAFEERGISPKRTRVGWDVICRVGDPTNPQDLIMVGAHRAVAISVMMAEQDLEEESGGGTANAATFRTVLALRKVLFAPEVKPPWNDLRIIVPLSRPSKAIHSVSFEAPTDDQVSRQVLLCQDLSVVLNTLMFTCCIQPGLADVFMDLLNFDGVALRLRKVKDFPIRKDAEPIVGKTFAEMSQRWENAILVGIIPLEFMDASEVDKANGIAPNGSRMIAGSDRLIFISRESLPTDVRTKPPRIDVDYTAKVVPIEKRPKKNLLVCGLQQVWKNPERMAFRISETSKSLASGSHIYFLNMMNKDDFMSIMDEASMYIDLVRNEATSSAGSHRVVWTLEDRITISYTEGDPANYDTLERVMVEQQGFDVSLVVPPVDTDMSAQAQDTRLMTIMCTLRTICENNNIPPVHVVGENKLESTAGLALRPKTDESIDETDFVNVQAIIARTLCQAMAFPFMQPAIMQLFDSLEGTPSVYIVSASLLVPLDYEITFFDLMEEVKEDFIDHICIGYRLQLADQVKQILCPEITDRVRFGEHDALVILSRKQPGVKQNGASSDSVSQSRPEPEKIAQGIDFSVIGPSTTPLDTEPFLLPTAINC